MSSITNRVVGWRGAGELMPVLCGEETRPNMPMGVNHGLAVAWPFRYWCRAICSMRCLYPPVTPVRICALIITTASVPVETAVQSLMLGVV
jgi:hypothetical protein